MHFLQSRTFVFEYTNNYVVRGIIFVSDVQKGGTNLMDKGYRVINPDCIISITHCYKGVMNWTTGKPITEEAASIIETEIITYVVSSLISPYNSDFHIKEDLFLDERKSKKSEYRARKEKDAVEGILYINQSKILIRDICPNGVFNLSSSNPVTTGTSTVIRTARKTFVCEGPIHHNSSSKYLDIDLAAVKAMCPTKELAFTFG